MDNESALVLQGIRQGIHERNVHGKARDGTIAHWQVMEAYAYGLAHCGFIGQAEFRSFIRLQEGQHMTKAVGRDPFQFSTQIGPTQGAWAER